MVEFKLINIDGDVYHYEYYPNGETSKKGSFRYDIKKKDIYDYNEAPYVNGRKFFLMTLRGIRDENNEFKKSGMVAWY